MRTAVGFLNRRSLFLIGVLAASILTIAARAFFFIWLQFPSPAGDSAFFAPVSLNRCVRGVFMTEAFPLDPSGQHRYIWHGILQPAVIWLLNFGCSNSGQFTALAVIGAASLGAIFYVCKKVEIDWTWALALAVVCLALQAKQPYRPETLAVFLCIFAEFAFLMRRPRLFTALIAFLMWTQLVATAIYLLFAIARLDRHTLAIFLRNALSCIMIFAFINAAIAFLQPFPLVDLIHGYSLQARNFALRADGGLSIYFTSQIRSDFFPLQGIVLALALIATVVERPLIALMIIPIWYFSIRAPGAIYNTVPLMMAMLLYLAHRIRTHPSALYLSLSSKATLVAALLCACAGLLQGDLRDLNSALHFRATAQKAILAVANLEREGYRICRVPPFFAVLFPNHRALPAWEPDAVIDPKPRWNDCSVSTSADVDLLSGPDIKDATISCQQWQTGPKLPILGRFFQSDSGYSFSICRR